MSKKLRTEAILFLVVIAFLGLANLFNTEKATVSELEHRALEKRPEFSIEALCSGAYFRRMENYYSDTFIFRDSIVKTSRKIQQLCSLLGPGITIVTAPEELSKHTETGQEGPSEEPGETEEPAENDLLPGMDGDGQNVGYWIVVDGRAVQLFKFNKENIDYYAAVLNQYRARVDGAVRIYSMIAPTNSEFVQLKRYREITDSQNEALVYLNSRLKPGIRSVNVYDVLNKHKSEYLYFRTDHHWTALGAYYGYCAFMKARGEQPVPLDRYRKVDLEGFLGSSYSKTLDHNLEKNPDTLTVYLPFTEHQFTQYYAREARESAVIDLQYAASKTDKYLVFISSGGGTWGVIRTAVKNGKRILVVKDSFGNALVPFLLPHYEEIYVVDSRFYSTAAAGKDILQFIRDNRIEELLFMQYMEDVNWRKFMEGVEALMGPGGAG